jgi:tetratricopeptide (TPR) repeat protein
VAKGRRAADRRREREQERADVDPRAETHVAIDARENTGEEDIAARAATALHEGQPLEHEKMAFGDDITDDTARLGDVAEVTAVRERPTPPRRDGGELRVLAGEGAGETVPVAVTPFVVGRASYADYVVTDETVSREHLELRYEPEEHGWVAEDGGSTSGSLLNGLPLSMPTEVKHGDVLAIGHMELRFLWAAELPSEKQAEPEPVREKTRTGLRAPPPEEKTRAKTRVHKPKREGSSKLPIIAAALLAALIVAGGAGGAIWFAFFQGATDKGQLGAQVTALTDEAQQLLNDGDFEQAKVRLEAALALVPGHPLATSMMRTVKSEMDAKAAIEEAARLFDEGKVEEALQVLGRVPDSSRFAERRDELRGRAGEIARKASLREIEALIEQGLLDEAEQKLAAHLKRWPRDTFAQAMRTRITAVRDAPPPEDPTLARARAAFEKGDALKARIIIEPAAARGSRVAERYLADLDRFEAALARGKRQVQAKDKGARKDLETAWSLLPRLGRSEKGGVGARLKKPLANALFLDAVAARAAGRDCDWAASVLKAKRLAPRDRKVAAQARAVEQKAKAALVRAEARAASDKTQAAQIAREGLCFAAKGSGTYKALQRLRK